MILISLQLKHTWCTEHRDSSCHRSPHGIVCISLSVGVLLDEALSFLDSVQALNFTSEEKTYVAVLNLCKWKTAKSEGRRVSSCLLGLKIVLDVEIGNALIGMLVKFGDLGDAWKVFGKMSERDVYSWNVLVGGYAKEGWFDEALSLYHKMLWALGGDGMRPDEFTLPCVLRTCDGMSNLGRGREVHAHVLRFGYGDHSIVVNAMIAMYVKCGDVVSVWIIFDRMPRRNLISWKQALLCYVLWFVKVSVGKTRLSCQRRKLAACMMYEIWAERNRRIFRHGCMQAQAIVTKILKFFSDHCREGDVNEAAGD
ncbi:hypothetical protein Drorol1_Dr00004932 [Drosera rotundifolia]